METGRRPRSSREIPARGRGGEKSRKVWDRRRQVGWAAAKVSVISGIVSRMPGRAFSVHSAASFAVD